MATRKLFSCDVMICATVYLVAENEGEAAAMLAARIGNEVTAGEEGGDFSGLSYDNPDLPAFSLSPCMTLVSGDVPEFHEETEIEEG